jgi:hypothetical protein
LDANFREIIAHLNSDLSSLASGGSLEAGIAVANRVLEILGVSDLNDVNRVIDDGLLKLPNSERQDPWFHPHPWMRGERAAFELADSNAMPFQAKFYWLQKRGNAYVAGGVHFTKNWEDHDFTRTDEFKIGIDFFLNQDSDAVLVVLSNRGKLRVMELAGRVSNTQLEIFERWSQLRSVTDRYTLHTSLWESFRLQAVNSKFYDGVANAFAELLSQLTGDGKDEEDAKLFASRLLGRLIFVWFLRKMKVISPAAGYFDCEGRDAGMYYRESLETLFFGTLNTPIEQRKPLGNLKSLDMETPYLNGGLFAPHPGDWLSDGTLRFPKHFFERLFEHFDQFNFTTDESTPEYEQVAIDPEMLGRVFESLLASQVSATGEQARKARGAFYTPREVVAYMCRESVRQHMLRIDSKDERLSRAVAKLLDTSDQDWTIAGSNSLRDIPQELRPKLSTALDEIRTLDPACGSGAYPLGLLQLLTKLHLRLDPRLDEYKLKLSILQRNIFGIDIEPMAIEISRLRAWLSLIVEEQKNKTLQPLPNLDFNFVCANSLIGLDGPDLFSDEKLQGKLSRLRDKYFLADAPEKKESIQTEYRNLVQPDLFDDVDTRASQLKTFNPFDADHVAAFFDAEHMFGIEDGFDIVIGNPPYIGEKGHTSIFEPVKKAELGKRFYQGKMDYFYYFFHLGLDLVREGGTVSFITTNYFITATFARKLIEDMATRSTILKMLNFGELRLFESAAGQHNMITLLSKGKSDAIAETTVVLPKLSGKVSPELLDQVFAGDETVSTRYFVNQNELIQGSQIHLSNSSENPIDQMLNRISQDSHRFDSYFRVLSGIESSVDTISQSHINKFALPKELLSNGVFVLTPDEVASLELDEHELEIIKPWFKNSDVSRYWVSSEPEAFLIFADRRTGSLESRPKLLGHLNRFRELIDSASSNSPYLARPRSTDYDSAKIVVPYKTPTTRFAIAYGPWYASRDIYYMVAINSVFSYRAAVGILNSKLVLCWLAHRGKRKGGLLELYQEPLAAIPFPKVTSGQEVLLEEIASLVASAEKSRLQDRTANIQEIELQIDELVARLYALTPQEIDLLSSWQFTGESS